MKDHYRKQPVTETVYSSVGSECVIKKKEHEHNNVYRHVPDKKVGGVGLLTYERAEELFVRRAKGKAHKYMSHETKLLYVENVGYRITYEDLTLLDICEHGWYIYMPYCLNPLYPGYCTRIHAYTGVSVYKRKEKGISIIEFGSPNYQVSALTKKPVNPNAFVVTPTGVADRFFVDYGFLDKNPFNFHVGLKASEYTKINGRKETTCGWYNRQRNYGRLNALFGTKNKCFSFLDNLFKRYTTDYLRTLLSSRGYRDEDRANSFLNSTDYQYSHGHKTHRDTLPPGMFETVNASSLSMFDINMLHKLVESSSDCGQLYSGIGNTSLIQGIFALAGLSFIPTKSHRSEWETKLDVNGMTPMLDKHSLGRLDGGSHNLYRWYYNQDWYYNQSIYKVQQYLDPDEMATFSLRAPIITNFFRYMCCVASDGPMRITDIHSETELAYLHDGWEQLQKTDLFWELGCPEGRFVHCMDIDDASLRKNRDVSPSTLYKHVVRKITNSRIDRLNCQGPEGEDGHRLAWVPHAMRTNIFPRIIFFTMMSEYMNNSLQPAMVLNSVRHEINSKVVFDSSTVSTDFPVLWDIMYSFFKKRLSGVFSKLIHYPKNFTDLTDSPVGRLYSSDGFAELGANVGRRNHHYYGYGMIPAGDEAVPFYLEADCRHYPDTTDLLRSSYNYNSEQVLRIRNQT